MTDDDELDPSVRSIARHEARLDRARAADAAAVSHSWADRDADERLEATLWGEPAPPRDPTPIVAGGAVLIVTLSPDEVRQLLELGVPDLVTGIHRALEELRA